MPRSHLRAVLCLTIGLVVLQIPPSSRGAVSDWAGDPRAVPWEPGVEVQRRPAPAESHQFDFLVGEWDVHARRYDPLTGALVSELRAEVRAEARNDGRLILEEWRGYSMLNGGLMKYGITLRTYSPQNDHWHNVFLSSHQAHLPKGFVTRWQNGEMVGGGEFVSDAGRTVRFRIVFFGIVDDSFEWKTEYRLDGENWRLERTQRFTRRQ